MRDIGEILDKINNWNKENVHELCGQIEEVKNYCHTENIASTLLLKDFSDLPSANFPPDIYTGHHEYPVWMMDLSNRCLVGPAANKVMSLAEVRESQNQ